MKSPLRFRPDSVLHNHLRSRSAVVEICPPFRWPCGCRCDRPAWLQGHSAPASWQVILSCVLICKFPSKTVLCRCCTLLLPALLCPPHPSSSIFSLSPPSPHPLRPPLSISISLSLSIVLLLPLRRPPPLPLQDHHKRHFQPDYITAKTTSNPTTSLKTPPPISHPPRSYAALPHCTISHSPRPRPPRLHPPAPFHVSTLPVSTRFACFDHVLQFCCVIAAELNSLNWLISPFH